MGSGRLYYYDSHHAPFPPRPPPPRTHRVRAVRDDEGTFALLPKHGKWEALLPRLPRHVLLIRGHGPDIIIPRNNSCAEIINVTQIESRAQCRSLGCGSVQLISVPRPVGSSDDSAEIFFRSLPREAIVSSSDAGRVVHSSVLSILQFFRRPRCRLP